MKKQVTDTNNKSPLLLGNKIKSFARVYALMEIVRDHDGLTLQELCELSQLNKSTVYRMASELCLYNFFTRDPETKRYRLGVAFLEFSSFMLSRLDIRHVAKELLSQLNNITHETIHLAMLQDDHVIYVDKRESKHSIRMGSMIGKIAPMHSTAVGKVILAYQDNTDRHAIVQKFPLQRYTNRTITAKDTLLKACEHIKTQGFATDDEENEKGVICIAAPIFNYLHQVVGSVSVSMVRIQSENVLQHKDHVVECAHAISTMLGAKKTPDIS